MTADQWSATIIFSLIAILSICSGTSAIAASYVPTTGLPGGYAPAEVGKDARDAAAFAVQEQAKREGIALTLASITKAEKQIVAGINYRVVLVVQRSGSAQKAKAVVFRDLQSHYSLASWEWLGD